jgi:hypothetical protein
MKAHGFRPVDIFDVLYRPLDNALRQFNLIFVSENFNRFQDLRFRA